MKITHVEFSALYNLGNYNNEKVGFRAQLEEGDTPESVVEQLREKAIALNVGHEGDAQELYRRIGDRSRMLQQLERKTNEAIEQWNKTAEFLRTQGINPDAPNLPTFKALMPSPAEEEVIEGELDDIDF